ncbi:MAG: helix-turn-helix transcriptional regulator [Acidimicrobiales bacterium]
MTRPSSAQRLARLLAVVPWVVAHDGPTVSEVCERFGISERELMADLNLLFMCGVYPYTPDALIEVDLDEGRVWVRFAEWFRRPLRLSPPEGLALVAAARAILGVPMTGDEKPDALASAVAKLETVLGAGGDDQLEIELGAAAPDVLGALQTAVADGRKVRLDYYSFGRDETGARVVRPWRVFSSEGHWYLLAWCEKVDAKRLFRVDRARSARVLDEHFDPPADLGPVAVYESRADDPVVTLDLAPGAHWVVERYPHEGTVDMGDGMVRARLRVSSRAWLERLLLRAGPDATVVSGADGVAPAAARRILAAYGHVTSRE